MSTELFDYIQVIKTSFGDGKRAEIGLMVMHYITLARVSDGCVKMDNVLTASGQPFTRKVMRHASLVRTLAFALKVDMTCIYDDSDVPEGLRRLCAQYHIDVQACINRNKKLEDTRNEMWDLVIFVRVAQAIMAALHEDTLRPGYKPKSKWFGLGAGESTAPIQARDLPRAKLPRVVGVKASSAPTLATGPVSMPRETSDKSSWSSSSDSPGLKSSTGKPIISPCAMHTPVASRPTGAYELISSMVTPYEAGYGAQSPAMAAYYQSMQQRIPSRRMY